MTNRIIKFRAWDLKRKEMFMPSILSTYSDNSDLPLHTIRFQGDSKNDFIIMQFTGLLDKTGKEIYPDDLLRVKGQMGNDLEYSYDAIYRVFLTSYAGVRLQFIRLTNPEPDSRENSYPINTSPAFENGKLCLDYKNEKYDCLCLGTDYYEESAGGRHNSNWYTNDIEVIGSIYTNPELVK